MESRLETRSEGIWKLRRPEVLAQMLDGRRSRDDQDIGRPLQKPSERDLHGRGIDARGDFGQSGRLEWSESAERKEPPARAWRQAPWAWPQSSSLPPSPTRAQ